MSIEAHRNPGDVIEPGDLLSYAAFCAARATILETYGLKGGSEVADVAELASQEMSTLAAGNPGSLQRHLESVEASSRR